MEQQNINPKISFGEQHIQKVSCGLTMEGETKKELMEVECALQEEFATQDKLTYYKPDLQEPFFKKPEPFS